MSEGLVGVHIIKVEKVPCIHSNITPTEFTMNSCIIVVGVCKFIITDFEMI